MGLHLVDMDVRTRAHMTAELQRDVDEGRLYISPRLSAAGRRDYGALLETALRERDDTWLAAMLRIDGRLTVTETRVVRGRPTEARVPVTAADTLAEGEVNRYYVRGLCLRAIDEGGSLVAYRAKAVSSPRPESQALLGRAFDPRTLLDDLRSHTGVEPALGLPPGPNSGLSVRLAP